MGEVERTAWVRTGLATEGSNSNMGVDHISVATRTEESGWIRKKSSAPELDPPRALNTLGRPSDPRRVHDREIGEWSYV